jgi:hypothetical protein
MQSLELLSGQRGSEIGVRVAQDAGHAALDAAVQPIVAALIAPQRQQPDRPLVSIPLCQAANLAARDPEPLVSSFSPCPNCQAPKFQA